MLLLLLLCLHMGPSLALPIWAISTGLVEILNYLCEQQQEYPSDFIYINIKYFVKSNRPGFFLVSLLTYETPGDEPLQPGSSKCFTDCWGSQSHLISLTNLGTIISLSELSGISYDRELQQSSCWPNSFRVRWGLYWTLIALY